MALRTPYNIYHAKYIKDIKDIKDIGDTNQTKDTATHRPSLRHRHPDSSPHTTVEAAIHQELPSTSVTAMAIRRHLPMHWWDEVLHGNQTPTIPPPSIINNTRRDSMLVLLSHSSIVVSSIQWVGEERLRR